MRNYYTTHHSTNKKTRVGSDAGLTGGIVIVAQNHGQPSSAAKKGQGSAEWEVLFLFADS
jgi:hypothetical protein